MGHFKLGLSRSRLRQCSVLILDGLIAASSLWCAMLLRFEGTIREYYLREMPLYLVVLVLCRISASYLCRLHLWSFRYSDLSDAVRVGIGAFVGSGMFIVSTYLLREPSPPRSVVVLELLLSALMMVGVRFSPRLARMYVRDWVRNRRDEALRTLIVGAGAAGEMLLRDLKGSPEHSYQVVGFVDDDRTKWDQLIGGKTVLGSIESLPQLVSRHSVDQVLIAIPRLPARRIREILTLCADLKLRFKILPVSFVYLQEKAAAATIQDLAPEDLLPREPVTFREERAGHLDDRRVLVTGAAGSIGSEVCRQLLRAGLRSLTVVDLDENGLYLMQRRFEREFSHVRIAVEIGSVRNRVRLRDLFDRHRPHDVIHAAAHKHVPLLEVAPCEAIKNNVVGTRHLVQLADEFGVERFVYISTDKAVRPTSVMGASKRVGEELVRSMARRSNTRFCAVRFGNVLGSAGSVVPIFREQIAEGGPVTVTSPDVRRYFMTISEAVALVLQAAYGDYGELCVLDMGEQIRIYDLARHMITMSGRVPGVDIEIKFTGMRPGEKMFEELMTDDEERTQRVDDKILVAECPTPRPDLDRLLDALERAASDEHTDEVMRLLCELVPSYAPARRALPFRRRAV